MNLHYMKFKVFILSAFFCFSTVAAIQAHATISDQQALELPGPGDKKKKNKEEKEPKSKVSKTQFKPAKAARLSAKRAKQSTRFKEKQIMGRAKTRNFFHRTFNTKFGKPVNFRSKRQRNRWKRGR